MTLSSEQLCDLVKVISFPPLCSWPPGVGLRHPAHILRISQEYQVSLFCHNSKFPALCVTQLGKFKIPATVGLLLPCLPASCWPLHSYSLCMHDGYLFSHLENTSGYIFISDSRPTSLTKPSLDAHPLQLYLSSNTGLCGTKCAKSCLSNSALCLTGVLCD